MLCITTFYLPYNSYRTHADDVIGAASLQILKFIRWSDGFSGKIMQIKLLLYKDIWTLSKIYICQERIVALIAI